MSSTPHTRAGRRNYIQIFQANVGKIPGAHDAALIFADETKAQVILLQEPWVSLNKPINVTKTHPNYTCHTPVQQWDSTDTRPRVLTYIRRSEGNTLTSIPVCPPSRDILGIRAFGINIVNAYREGNTPHTIDILEGWDPPGGLILAGDFNAHYATWQPGVAPTPGAARLATWADTHSLPLLNEPGVPTHDLGNVLDLVFSDMPLSKTRVADDLHTGSDHSTLVTTIPCTPPSRPALNDPGTYILGPADHDIFEEQIAVQAAAISLPLNHRAPETHELDTLAADIAAALQRTLRTAGHRPRPDGKSETWWNDDCKEKRTAFHNARKEDPDSQETADLQKEFRSTVRRAKAQKWISSVNNITTAAHLYKVMGWLNSRPQFQSPPMQDGDRTLTDPAEKAAFLRRRLLERANAENDISPNAATCPQRLIPWTDEIGLEEARRSLLDAGNTAPGADGITVTMLRLSWGHIGPYVHYLYRHCLRLGHHPALAKEAEVVMIPKPNRDPSTPKGWRPISLLSCLGKGLERLIARRLAHAAVAEGVLPPQVAGALPKRSAIDIVSALVHDVEAALNRGLVATAVTADIEGAFDTTLRFLLLYRLRTQGWPPNVVSWVSSFMKGRRARIRHDDYVTDMSDLHCGLPQGSPASLILFLLYTALIHSIGGEKRRFGYADDSAMLAIARTLKESTRQAQEMLDNTILWGRENGSTFDPDKTEVMHFSRRREDPDDIPPPIIHGTREVHPDKAMRWLGMWLDKTLSFKRHIEVRAAKARTVSKHIKGLNKVHSGIPPHAARKAVATIVIPKALYGSEIWWPGQTRPGKKRVNGIYVPVQNGLSDQVAKIQVALNVAIRGALPIWCTTPLPATWREASIPPVKLLLDQARSRHALRLGTLDHRHPLTERVATHRPLHNRGNAIRPTTLTDAAAQVPAFPRPELQPRQRDKPPPQYRNKEFFARRFHQWIATLTDADITVYSDGSQLEGRSGFGYALYKGQSNTPLHTGCRPLPQAEVFDAEIEGARAGLRAATTLTPSASTITVCLDNTAAINCLQGSPTISSQAAALDFQQMSAASNATVSIRWSPGHMDIPGNEMADQLAKRGSSIKPVRDPLPTYSHVKRDTRAQHRAALEAWWQDARPQSYANLGLSANTGPTKELQTLSRTALHHLLAARSGHGDFADYHERFNHLDANLYCTCKKEKTPAHPLFCRKTHHWRRLPWIGQRRHIDELLGTRWHSFITPLIESDFFNTICPRY